MNSVRHSPSRKNSTLWNGSRVLVTLFPLFVAFAAIQLSHSFTPSAVRSTHDSRSCQAITTGLKQQLTQIEPIRNKGVRGEIGIDKSVRNSNNNTESTATSQPKKNDVFGSFNLSKARIESAVDEMMKSTRTIGLIGETSVPREEESFQYLPKGNTVLATAAQNSARVASPMDDLDIANLRLSVFSNFNPESRQLFCDRSCALLNSRRQRGATCIVATSNKKCDEELSMDAVGQRRRNSEHIIGTAEISFHEFSQTLLGYSRPKDSLLYVTEVAVDSNQRRKGVAKLMMEGIDTLAKIREVETIYLHVDVTNDGAVRLYEKAGYSKMDSSDPMYLEFTTKLNLHDGATKGRCHYLMSKDIQRPTWLNVDKQQKGYRSHQRTLGIEVMPTF